MATLSLCGSDGVVDGSGAVEITFWEITQTVATPDATSFDSLGWVERIACLKTSTGSFRSIGSPATLGAHSVTFKTDTAAGYTISGALLISDVGVDTDINDVVSFNHTFSFTGAVTVA